MPNRIIKETIRTSRTINSLSDFEFRVWVYLITYVDDYGRGSADPELINSFVLPRMKGLDDEEVFQVLQKLDACGCIKIYESDGEPYFYFPKWEDHQRIRNKKSRFPDPSDCKTKKNDADCGELPQIAAESAHARVESNPIQYESNNILYSPEPKIDSEPSEANIPLNTGEEYPVYQKDIDEWQKLYPAVDVRQELNKMRGWCLANPSKRKTNRGVKKFINNWLSRQQDRGGTPGFSLGNASGLNGSRGDKKYKVVIDENGFEKFVEDTD